MLTTYASVLDRLSPDEAHLPPGVRTWARELRDGYGVLEMRDPNDGLGGPAGASRYQYTIGRGYAWRRVLPPAPLEPTHHLGDDSVAWEPWVPTGLVAEWVAEHAQRWVDRPVPNHELPPTLRWKGRVVTMPARHPWDVWPDITGAPCPVPGCGHELVWYEAGYVPGYRVCMARLGSGYDARTLRHQFRLVHDTDATRDRRDQMVLERVATRGGR